MTVNLVNVNVDHPVRLCVVVAIANATRDAESTPHGADTAVPAIHRAPAQSASTLAPVHSVARLRLVQTYKLISFLHVKILSTSPLQKRSHIVFAEHVLEEYTFFITTH